MLDKFEIKLYSHNPINNTYFLRIIPLSGTWGYYKYLSNKFLACMDNGKIVGIEIEDVLNFNNIENIRDAHLIPQEIQDCWNWVKETNYIQKQLIFK